MSSLIPDSGHSKRNFHHQHPSLQNTCNLLFSQNKPTTTLITHCCDAGDGIKWRLFKGRLVMVLVLFLILAPGPAFALSWHPSLSVGGGPLFSINLSLEKEELPARLSFMTEAAFTPLALTINERHYIGLGLRASIVTDSLQYNNTFLIGSRRASVFAEFEEFFDPLALDVSAGLGYALLNYRDIGYFYISGKLGLTRYFTRHLGLNLSATVNYRREMIEVAANIAMRFVMPSQKGGEK